MAGKPIGLPFKGDKMTFYGEIKIFCFKCADEIAHYYSVKRDEVVVKVSIRCTNCGEITKQIKSVKSEIFNILLEKQKDD